MKCCVNFLVRQANKEHVYGIVELFESNYINKYHYDEFTSPLKLVNLLESKRFKGWVVLSENEKVIGFCGVYLENNDWIKLIKLAHLLVDKNYRGNGIGELLEETREQYYSSLKDPNIVIVSCVEKPIYSIELKRKRGFNILGVRLFYRPDGKFERTNSVLMGLINVNDFENNFKYIERPSDKTKKLISMICNDSNNRTVRKFSSVKSNFLCRYEMQLNKKLGRAIGIVKYHENGVPIKKVIDELKSTSYPYMAIYLDAQSRGFAEADYNLNLNHFLPLAYVPYFDRGMDLVEYQFISDPAAIDHQQINKYTNEFLNEIIW